MTTHPAGDTWTQRADRASSDLEAHRQLEEAKIEVRDSLVVEGIDTGHSLAATARALRLSQARVHQILARRG